MKATERRIFGITTLVCLLPLVFSLFVYRKLPDQVAIHWNALGQADGYASKAMAAFGLPALLLLAHLIVRYALLYDPKRENQAPVMRLLSLWIVPVLSCVLTPVTLLIAMDTPIAIERLGPVLVGAVFLLIGNYLPKSRQNYTIGIKLPWTLHDADNWNRTHRMAGPLWMVCGVLMMLSALLDFESTPWLIGLIVALPLSMALIPILYSFFLYRHTHKGGRA